MLPFLKTLAVRLSDDEREHSLNDSLRGVALSLLAMAEKAMLNNPTLPGGNSTKTVTREEFNNMGYREMAAFKAEHPDLYAEYMK